MVYETCRSGKGKKVVNFFYLRCHHKQRQSGMHTKSNNKLIIIGIQIVQPS